MKGQLARSLAIVLVVCFCCTGSVRAELIPANKAVALKFISNNHVPLKVLVVNSYSTGQFVRDLFKVIREINREPFVPADEKIVLHIVSSSGDPTTSWGLTAEEKKWVEVNPNFSSSDIWMQDCMELVAAKLADSNQWVPAVFDSQRGRGLARLPRVLADMWNLVYFSNPTTQGSHGDYGGNLEVVPFDDVLAPGNTITTPCKEYLKKMGYANRMFTPQASWLSVGHIDEYLSYIPTPHAPGGYSIVRADPNYALELLTNMPDSELNGLNSSDRGLLLRVRQVLQAQLENPNAGKGTTEGNFIELNRSISDIIERTVGELKNYIRSVTKDPDRDFAEVAWPCFFQGRGTTNPSGCHALLPGVVNMLVLRDHLVVPACNVPAFDKVIEARFRAQGNKVHFVNDQAYHNSMGEIHCGTNVLRHITKQVLTKKRVEAVQRVKQQFRAIHE